MDRGHMVVPGYLEQPGTSLEQNLNLIYINEFGFSLRYANDARNSALFNRSDKINSSPVFIRNQNKRPSGKLPYSVLKIFYCRR